VLADDELGATLRDEFRLDLPAADVEALIGWAAWTCRTTSPAAATPCCGS
jgi:hypothetical protein